MGDQDLGLLFGVEGNGSLSGASGDRIKRQLEKIMTELNSNPLKVAVQTDTSAATKKSWANQIQKTLDQISENNSLSVQVSTIKLSPGAVNGFKQQLASIIGNLSSFNGPEITISSSGLKQTKADALSTIEDMSQLGDVIDRVRSKYEELYSKAPSEVFIANIERAKGALQALGSVDVLSNFSNSLDKICTGEGLSELLKIPAGIRDGYSSIKSFSDVVNDQFKTSIKGIEDVDNRVLILLKSMSELKNILGSFDIKGNSFLEYLDTNLSDTDKHILGVYNDVEKLRSLLHGLSVNYEGLINYSNTLGLDSLWVGDGIDKAYLDTLKLRDGFSEAKEAQEAFFNALTENGAVRSGDGIEATLRQLQAVVDKFPQAQQYIDEINSRIIGVGAQDVAQKISEIGVSAKNAGTEAANAAKAVSELNRSTQDVGKDEVATNWEGLLKRIANAATQARSLLEANTEASKASVSSESISYQKLTEQLGILDGILKECKGDADNLEAALKNVDIHDVLSKTSAAIATMKNELDKTSLSGSTSLRELTDTVTKMQALLNKNPQMKGSGTYEVISKQIDALNSVINACEGNTNRLESALRKAGINSASVIEDARSAMSLFNAEIEDTRAVTGSISAFQRASQAIKEYYSLLYRASKIRTGDIVLTPDGYQSVSGDYANLALELNKAADAFGTFTSQASKSKMSETELMQITKLLEQQECNLTLAIEERAAKQKASVNETVNETSAVKVQMESLADLKRTIRGLLQSSEKKDSTTDEIAKIVEIKTQYEQWARKIQDVIDAKSAIPTDQKAEIEAEGAAIREKIGLLNEARKAREAASATGKSDAKKEDEYQKKLNATMTEGIKLLEQMKKAKQDWSAANSGKTKGNYSAITSGITELSAAYEKLMVSTNKSEDELKEFQMVLSRVRDSFKQNSDAIELAGKKAKTFSDRLGNLAQKFSAWFGVTRVIMYGVRAVRQMISATIELDNAMTQLEIVTRNTSQAYEEYLEKITQTATKIGSAVPDLIDSTTTFARLGYSLEESSALAEFTAMLKNVGNIEVSDAQNAITAIIKAFGVSVDEIESIMDKLVITGNNFPISVSQIAEGMNNASSALAAAGNTFEQSVALMTAANTTIQNAAKSSTGLRTIAARLRSTKTELDELGEDMTEAKYNDLVAALTKYNVALTDMNGEFRSTYEIVEDIAKIWDKLSTMEQAALANTIAGVRQQSVFYSLVEQFQEATGAMEDMAHSAGTLQDSYSVFMESVTAHINEFKAAFQSLGMSAFPTEFLTGMVDLGTTIVKILNVIAKLSNVIGGLNSALYVTVGLIASVKADVILSKLKLLTVPIQEIVLNIGVFREAYAAAFAASMTSGASMMASSIAGLSAGFKGLAASASTAQIAVGSIFAVVGVILLVKKAVENAREKAAELAEAAEAAFQKTTEELEGVNSELDTAKSRLEDLQKLSDAGTIALVDQEELDNLKMEVELLERRKAILQEQALQEGKDADKALVEAFDKKEFDSSARDYYVAERKALEERYNALMGDGLIDQANLVYEQIAKVNDILTSGYDNVKKIYLDGKLNYEEYIKELASYYNEMYQKYLANPEDMSVSGLEYMEDIRKRLVAAGADISENFIGALSVDKNGTIISQDIMDRFKSLFDIADIGVNRLSRFSSALESISGNITGILSDLGTKGELTAERVSQMAREFPELGNAMEVCGVSTEEVASHFNALSISVNNTAKSTEELLSSVKTLETLDTINQNIESVSKALGEFSEEGRVSVDTLAGMADELKNLSSFENFVNILSDSASSMEEVQNACNNLAEEYINATGILDSLNESNAHLIETILEEMGVVNAHEIVQERLNAVQLEGVLSSNNLTNASWDTAEAFLKESGASETAITSLQRLRQEQYNARLAAIDLTTATTDTIQALMNQASAAGVAANSISALATLKKVVDLGFEHYAKDGMTEAGYQALLDNAKRAAQADLSKIGKIALPQVKVSLPKSSSKSSSKASKGSGTSKKNETAKEVEEYIAEIDKYREAEERLRKVREESANIERRVDNESDIRKRIALEHQMIGIYGEEQAALKNLNAERSADIEKNVKALRDMEFKVEYNAETNDLWISNMERLNDLKAESKGKYETLQEATNALRKEAEELINTTTELNDKNRDSVESQKDLSASTSEMKHSVIEDLKEIVEQSSAAVDEIQNVYSTLSAAADEYAQNGGFISIDAYQDILALGPQYMQYLMDENEQLIINEERINQVIEAKTRQLAADQALTYVERLKIALQDGQIENLNTLLYATTAATNATFGLAYAELELMRSMGDLDESQFQAALHNIQAIESLCETAVRGIGRVAGEAATAAKEAAESAKKELESLKGELEEMQEAGDSIIDYVMEMLKHRIQQQIDLLEEMKDKYSEIIDMKKKSLEASKDEQDYQKTIAKKLKEMAKLQERINALSLDDSRSAQAERAKLLDELAELQEDLSDTQADKAIENQKEALDQMEDDYHAEKDAEIKILEDSISSTQKLYTMAINYIRDHWNTLYSELLEEQTTPFVQKCA